ncbi:MAG: hemerythrin domain-containing protein [Candidatus Limnocylindrales bacterium]
MSQTLQAATHEHHSRLTWHVDHLPMLGDRIGAVSFDELAQGVDESVAFLNGLLIPHLEAAEHTIYPELERMLQNRHSMAPMRREHAEIRQLVSDLVDLQTTLDGAQLSTGHAVALRRVIFRLYALLKIHLAEEELYIDILEHGVSAEAGAALAAAMEHSGIPLA